jgi:hypothetical protein
MIDFGGAFWSTSNSCDSPVKNYSQKWELPVPLPQGKLKIIERKAKGLIERYVQFFYTDCIFYSLQIVQNNIDY